MDKLLYTTYDQDKVNDLQEILGELNLDIEVIGLSSIDYAPQKSYSEETFLNNARNTAHRLAEYTKLPTLSESSGLSVDYLFNSLEILPYHHNFQGNNRRSHTFTVSHQHQTHGLYKPDHLKSHF